MTKTVYVIVMTISIAFFNSVDSKASVDTNGMNGIHSDVLPLDGTGISIGQVERERPGKFGFDDGAHSNFGTIPEEVYIQHAVKPPTANDNDELINPILMDGHATQVAGVMISNDPSAPGVAGKADLYAATTVGDPGPFVPTQDSVSFTTQFIATRDNDDVRAINLSFGLTFEMDEVGTGNSKYTEFIDWSATVHDTLYVVAGNETGSGVNFGVPTDNFNGITVGASTKVGGVYRQVADFNDSTHDPSGARTSISLIAPGDDVELADIGGPIPPTVHPGTSFAAPHVTGTVALLQQHAERKIMTEGMPQWTANARRHEVMKAVLLNSADKIQGVLGMERTVLNEDGTSTWVGSDADLDDEVPLDIEMGAGHLNAKRAHQ